MSSQKKSKHWTGIHRQSGKITEDMDRLKSTLAILLDESKPLKGRLDTLFPPREKSRIKGLGRAVVTPILMVVSPEPADFAAADFASEDEYT